MDPLAAVQHIYIYMCVCVYVCMCVCLPLSSCAHASIDVLPSAYVLDIGNREGGISKEVFSLKESLGSFNSTFSKGVSVLPCLLNFRG